MTDVVNSPTWRLDPTARRKLERFVSALHEGMPGLFDEIFLVGSAACQDFRPGKSDLGFVAVSRERLPSSVLDRLGELHERLAAETPASPLDGIYVAAADLARGPRKAPSGPHARLDRFWSDGCHKRRPLDWHAVATSSIALWENRENAPEIWMNQTELDHDLLRAADELEVKTGGPDGLDHEAASSAILEAARLHFTLLTGRLTSKTKAGLYGLIAFPERWRPILDEALASRGAGAVLPSTLSRNAGLFVCAVAEDMRGLAEG